MAAGDEYPGGAGAARPPDPHARHPGCTAGSKGRGHRDDQRFAGTRQGLGFTDKQVQLLKTFAHQAVIAIENVRLFKELEARTQDLTRSVGELRALGDVGRALGQPSIWTRCSRPS